MIDNTVFDILIYVFDRYMLEELPASAERESLARDLESAGFGEANVERALDWLADLAEQREDGNPAISTTISRAQLPSRIRAGGDGAAGRRSAVAC